MIILDFSPKWVSWIGGALVSSKASMLVKGRPSLEFQLKRGLRQGDPLSPFLFVIIMEALHVDVLDAIDANFIRGIKIGNLLISHFIYADDVLFLTKWPRANV
uniref:Reverse transcriptase domain-containing protein n=1 Tax=Lactuca sativa TaxID=4236 RepID=A0A9R1W4I1_LACSA|nr:hypothetical protein LSAT_V11C300134550 [Lactuca sativa]